MKRPEIFRKELLCIGGVYLHANLTVQEVFEEEEEDIFWEMKTCLACKFAGTGGFED